MKWFSEALTINAPTARVWTLLVDAKGWAVWNPEAQLEGELRAHAELTWVEARGEESRRRELPVRVAAFDSRERLALTSTEGMPALFHEWTRTYALAPRPGGRTELTQVLELGGLLTDVALLADPDRQESLRRTSLALKRHAERDPAVA